MKWKENQKKILIQRYFLKRNEIEKHIKQYID